MRSAIKCIDNGMSIRGVDDVPSLDLRYSEWTKSYVDRVVGWLMSGVTQAEC